MLRNAAVSKWGALSIVVALGVTLDQITKRIAHAELRMRGIVTVVEGFFDFRYSRNPGAFFSLGADMSGGIRRAFFIAASLVAIGLIVHLFRKAAPTQRALQWALMLLLAGAVGNLVDRVLYGEVIDFLHLHWHDAFHWATFNVADIFISAGLGLLLVDLVGHQPDADVVTGTAVPHDPESTESVPDTHEARPR